MTRRFKRGGTSVTSTEPTSGSGDYGCTTLALPETLELFVPEIEEGKTSASYTIEVMPYICNKNKVEKYYGKGDDRWQKNVAKDTLASRIFYSAHKFVGPKNATVVCTFKSNLGLACPLCMKARDIALENGNNWSAKEVKALNPQYRSAMVIRFPKSKEPEKLWLIDYSYACFGKPIDDEIASMLDEDAACEEQYYAELEGGSYLTVRFSKDTYNNREYLQVTKVGFKSRPKDLDEAILDTIPNLDDMLILTPTEDIEAMLGLPAAEEAIEAPEPAAEAKATDCTSFGTGDGGQLQECEDCSDATFQACAEQAAKQ